MALIAVVEDNPEIAKLFKAIFESDGYEVKTFSNAYDALDFLNRGTPVDVVLTDVLMTGMSGLDFIKQVRTQERFAQLPLVVVTALSAVQARKDAIEAGCTSFITKPILSSAQLLAHVKTYLPSEDEDPCTTSKQDGPGSAEGSNGT